jgi:hypothetical protein
MGVSVKTVRRLLLVNPAHLCIDGTSTRKTKQSMEPYRGQVRELLSKEFKPSQILKKLQEMYPGRTFKRTTVNDLCCDIREETTGYRSISAAKGASPQKNNSKANKVKRRDLVSAIWSGSDKIPENDIAYIEQSFPVFIEIKSIIIEFREAYAKKDVATIDGWVDKYADCPFPGIKSFIGGIRKDEEAFFNSIKYEYSNGLLEGCVNKLKTIKRSMYGRAHYGLLRAKMLLSGH